MDKLPDELRAMLELASDAHDPVDDQAQQRVRLAIAAAIGLPAGGALGGDAALGKAATVTAAKTGWFAAGGKLTTLTVAAIAAAGLSVAIYRTRTPDSVVGPVAAPVAQAPLAPAPVASAPLAAPVVEPAPAVSEVQAQPAAAQPAPKAKRKQAAPVDTLQAEMALLRAASEALARGDEAGALVQLRTHARSYPQGSLREERDGLRAIAECTRDSDPSTQAAQRFAKQYPNSLLAARVAAACSGR